MNDRQLFQQLGDLAIQATPLVLVTLVEATGSTPQDQGAKMIVTHEGLYCGTVGGGRVEAKAIDTAREMLSGGGKRQFVDWNLKADVGMTCGGRVKLFFEVHGVHAWPIVIFGAGHVAQALARLLIELPCQVTCIDPRADWLARLPAAVHAVQVDEPAEEVARLPRDAFVLCMTQGHRNDLPVLERLLTLGYTFPYVGVIGSKAKAAVLRKELAAAGVAAQRTTFHCPVGLPIGSNHPGEIAVSIAAQLLQVRDEVAVRNA
jgi:xanthine dehydrogenase accessory factor